MSTKNSKVGDKLTFNGPSGRFIVRKSRGGPKLFLAGGTGVSSPRSMILDLLEEGYAEPITLVHGVRTQADLYGREDFEALAARHPNFRYVPALSSEPEDSAWKGERGFVHDVAKRVYGGQFEGNTAYLCGPPHDDRSLHRRADAGAPVRKAHFHRAVLHRQGLRGKAEKPVVQEALGPRMQLAEDVSAIELSLRPRLSVAVKGKWPQGRTVSF